MDRKVYYFNLGKYFIERSSAFFTIAELDPDAFLFSNLYECLSSDEKVMADG